MKYARHRFGGFALALMLVAHGLAVQAEQKASIREVRQERTVQPYQQTGMLKAMQGDRFTLPAPVLTGSALNLWATYYYVHPAATVRNGQPLLDLEGKPISTSIAARNFCLGAIEGTIRVQGPKASRTFNLAGKAEHSQIDCRPLVDNKEAWVADLGKSRFRLATGPFGDGVAQAGDTSGNVLSLVPFRSIATDPRLIAPGTVVFIAAARGMSFRGSTGARLVHDGYFLAADVGPAIQGEHIDIFAGLSTRNPFPSWVRSEPGGRFAAQVIGDPAIRTYLLGLHTLSGDLHAPASAAR